jgi:hypothetical protein
LQNQIDNRHGDLIVIIAARLLPLLRSCLLPIETKFGFSTLSTVAGTDVQFGIVLSGLHAMQFVFESESISCSGVNGSECDAICGIESLILSGACWPGLHYRFDGFPNFISNSGNICLNVRGLN